MILFAVRSMPGASIRVDGLTKVSSFSGWTSDGRQSLELYGAKATREEIAYVCEIAATTSPAASRPAAAHVESRWV
jgi:hypothetical protein